MIPLTFLYDECIDRPKLTEQKKTKKPSWVYSSFPQKWGRIKNHVFKRNNFFPFYVYNKNLNLI